MVDHSYERTTQLAPASAVLAPVSVLVVVIFRADDVVSVIRSVIGIAAAAGFHLIAMRLVRDRGNAIQGPLWESWGGSTTVQRLRWHSASDAQIARLHHRVRTMTGVALPTQVQQDAALEAADEMYSDAIARLREMTRDHARYPRVWSELQQYGAARNMYGARPFAVLIAGAVTAVSAALTVASLTDGWSVPWWLPAVAGSFSILAGITWVTLISPKYVRTASERYSDALLSTPNEPGSAQ